MRLVAGGRTFVGKSKRSASECTPTEPISETWIHVEQFQRRDLEGRSKTLLRADCVSSVSGPPLSLPLSLLHLFAIALFVFHFRR